MRFDVLAGRGRCLVVTWRYSASFMLSTFYFQSLLIPVKVGESFESCAIRELAEETGITSVVEVKVLPFVSNDILPFDGKHYVTVFVSLDVSADSSASLMETSHREWRWVSLDQLPSPVFSSFQSLLDSGSLGV